MSAKDSTTDDGDGDSHEDLATATVMMNRSQDDE